MAPTTLTSNQQINAVLPSETLSMDYIYYALCLLSPKIADSASEQAVPIVNKSSFAATIISLPPTLTEQRAIAEALSDADALIASLDALIAKKRDLKQAAMQQLLTGKTRLPGFKGEWKTISLGELGNAYGGLTGKSKADFGHGAAKYIQFMNVMSNVVIDVADLGTVDVDPVEHQNQVERGDLFFNGSSETPQEVGMCSLLNAEVEKVYLNSFCFGFRFGDKSIADGNFFAYFFRSDLGRRLLSSLAQGATRYNLSKRSLLALRFRCPSVSEQTAITGVLSDMDAELAALESKRNKARAIKQAMMQELLTGRIRLT